MLSPVEKKNASRSIWELSATILQPAISLLRAGSRTVKCRNNFIKMTAKEIKTANERVTKVY